MTKQELEQWLTQHSWKRTPYGHYEKSNLRFKMSKTSVRLESFSR